jgi:thiol-disulfide isomerase/thioredoxin
MAGKVLRCLCWASVCVALAACSPAPAKKVPPPAAQPPASHIEDKPVFVKGATPVAPFVAEAQLAAGDARLIVYVGASWCEPCQRFHHALQAGELDNALRGVRFVEYDSDVAKPELEAAGYRSRLIPLFAVPAEDGRASGRQQEGSIKGEGAVQNILPRLQEMLGRPAQ